MNDRYLGDGVYASWNGYAITLDLRAQPPSLPITAIVLEPEVMNALRDFETDCNAEALDASINKHS